MQSQIQNVLQYLFFHSLGLLELLVPKRSIPVFPVTVWMDAVGHATSRVTAAPNTWGHANVVIGSGTVWAAPFPFG